MEDAGLILLVILAFAAVILFPIYVLSRLGQLNEEISELKRQLAQRAVADERSKTERLAQVLKDLQPPQPVSPPPTVPPPTPFPQEPVVIPAPPSVPPPTVVIPAQPVKPSPQRRPAGLPPSPSAPPPPPAVAPAPAAPRPNLESLLGANWLSKVGIAAIAIAAAFFLQYAFHEGWIGPAAQVVIGIAAALIMFGLGQYLLKKVIYRAYAQVLAAGGIIVFFLSIYAGYGYYHLPWLAFPVAFAVLALAALMASAMAVKNNTQAVAAICLAGAFATPLLIRQAGSASGDLFRLYAYLAGLNIWSAILVKYRPWHSLTALAFGFTWLLFFGAGRLQGPNHLLTEGFATAFLAFACYGGMANFKTQKDPDEAAAGLEWRISMLLLGCLAFIISSAMILTGVKAFGLPAFGIIGVMVALLMSGLGAAFPGAAAKLAAIRQVFQYLSAAGLVLLMGITVVAAPPITAAQVPAAFAFSFIIYLVFLDVARNMLRTGESETPAIFLLAANVLTHIMAAFHILAPIQFWGINAVVIWLPYAGMTAVFVLELQFLLRKVEPYHNYCAAVMIAAQSLSLSALFGAWAGFSRQSLDAAGGIFVQFIIISATWIGLRRRTRLPGFRGDIVGAFGNAAIFFLLLASAIEMQKYVGFGILCGYALALALYHALIFGAVLRRADDDSLYRFIYLGLALAFVTIAIPLQLKDSYITLAWSIESALLVWAGLAFVDRRIRWYGVVVLALAAAKAFFLDMIVEPKVFHLLWNTRMLAGAAVIAAAYVSAWLLRRKPKMLSEAEANVPATALFLASLYTLIFISLELWDYFGQLLPASGRFSALLASYSIFWCAYALVLLVVGLRKSVAWIWRFGAVLLAVAALKSLFIDIFVNPVPFRLLLNSRMLSGAVVIIAAYLAAWLIWQRRDRLSKQENYLPAIAAFVASLCMLIFVSKDIWQYLGGSWEAATRSSAQQLALSIFWLLYALTAILVGIWKRIRIIRLFAMGLLYLSIIKVFLFDLRFLEQPYRIVSFFGLGVILLVVSLLYTRFEERLK